MGLNPVAFASLLELHLDIFSTQFIFYALIVFSTGKYPLSGCSLTLCVCVSVCMSVLTENCGQGYL